uniref:hypothetical protein n=1 Tax=Okeania sp. SIO2F4 TaxID=2607790 RepID=UPI0025EC189F|nr:hypothetical protein [Okeania sp. SIO2F4]
MTQLPLTYFDSIIFEANGSSFHVEMSNIEHQLLILLKNILLLNISKNSFSFEEDFIDAIEITHKYRKITEDDLIKYSFLSKDIENEPPLHIITIYGNVAVEVICAEVEIKRDYLPQ